MHALFPNWAAAIPFCRNARIISELGGSDSVLP
jgi:hypothetical protein